MPIHSYQFFPANFLANCSSGWTNQPAGNPGLSTSFTHHLEWVFIKIRFINSVWLAGQNTGNPILGNFVISASVGLQTTSQA